MTQDEHSEILRIVKAARAKARGYSDFFGWPPDRDLEERGVVDLLLESLTVDGTNFFKDVSSRGRGNDPPDCDAIDFEGNRIAIEVTELVDPAAIRAYKQGHQYCWADWTRESFTAAIDERLTAKDRRFAALKDAPYPGGYIVIIHTDEPLLLADTVARHLTGHTLRPAGNVTRAFLLLSYDPHRRRYPYFELAMAR